MKQQAAPKDGGTSGDRPEIQPPGAALS
jgi:hypothetical protein